MQCRWAHQFVACLVLTHLVAIIPALGEGTSSHGGDNGAPNPPAAPTSPTDSKQNPTDGTLPDKAPLTEAQQDDLINKVENATQQGDLTPDQWAEAVDLYNQLAAKSDLTQEDKDQLNQLRSKIVDIGKLQVRSTAPSKEDATNNLAGANTRIRAQAEVEPPPGGSQKNNPATNGDAFKTFEDAFSQHEVQSQLHSPATESSGTTNTHSSPQGQTSPSGEQSTPSTAVNPLLPLMTSLLMPGFANGLPYNQSVAGTPVAVTPAGVTPVSPPAGPVLDPVTPPASSPTTTASTISYPRPITPSAPSVDATDGAGGFTNPPAPIPPPPLSPAPQAIALASPASVSGDNSPPPAPLSSTPSRSPATPDDGTMNRPYGGSQDPSGYGRSAAPSSAALDSGFFDSSSTTQSAPPPSDESLVIMAYSTPSSVKVPALPSTNDDGAASGGVKPAGIRMSSMSDSFKAESDSIPTSERTTPAKSSAWGIITNYGGVGNP